jgi:hypothetical protein
VRQNGQRNTGDKYQHDREHRHPSSAARRRQRRGKHELRDNDQDGHRERVTGEYSGDAVERARQEATGGQRAQKCQYRGRNEKGAERVRAGVLLPEDDGQADCEQEAREDARSAAGEALPDEEDEWHRRCRGER